MTAEKSFAFSVIEGSGGREQLLDQLLRELLFKDEPDRQVIEKLRAQIDRPEPELRIVSE